MTESLDGDQGGWEGREERHLMMSLTTSAQASNHADSIIIRYSHGNKDEKNCDVIRAFVFLQYKDMNSPLIQRIIWKIDKALKESFNKCLIVLQGLIKYWKILLGLCCKSFSSRETKGKHLPIESIPEDTRVEGGTDTTTELRRSWGHKGGGSFAIVLMANESGTGGGGVLGTKRDR